jgi:hypothetical protein
MAITTTMRVMILVKAAPVLTAALRESMCVAAISLDDPPCWIRLHPVPFRDLEDNTKFRKYQEVTVEVIRPKSDRRPESWTPIEGTIVPGATIGTDRSWSRRRERVEGLGSDLTMCELIELNRSGSGPGTPSLAVVRTREAPRFVIEERDDEQLANWRSRADAIGSQPSLFEDPGQSKAPFEVIPWRFSYRYHCLSPQCSRGHKQTIVDWEVVALYRNVRSKPDWRELMRQKFEDELWAPERDTVLFVGNMEQRPWNFLVLGVFWPPSDPMQPSLLG